MAITRRQIYRILDSGSERRPIAHKPASPHLVKCAELGPAAATAIPIADGADGRSPRRRCKTIALSVRAGVSAVRRGNGTSVDALAMSLHELRW